MKLELPTISPHSCLLSFTMNTMPVPNASHVTVLCNYNNHGPVLISLLFSFFFLLMENLFNNIFISLLCDEICKASTSPFHECSRKYILMKALTCSRELMPLDILAFVSSNCRHGSHGRAALSTMLLATAFRKAT